LWLGFYGGGIAYFKDGQVGASYTAADGLGHGIISDIRQGSDGAVWVAGEGGLSRSKTARVTTLTSKKGLPCDTVHWSIEDDDHSVWLYMPCGLMRIARSELDAWVTDSKRKIQTTIFDSSDGVRSRGLYGGYGPHVTKSPDGKIWFLPGDGVSIIDPQRLPINKLPPPVHIEQVTADHKTYHTSRELRLPPRVRDLEIDYTALSFVAPEKNRFNYKLEGYDPDWVDAGNRRQAFYTNLGPRNYRFRVMASNNSGVWNEAGASLNFSIDPAYYQTVWFRALCFAGFLWLLWMIYRMRVRQLARDFNLRVEERVNERTRVARELHDTLLQSVQASLVQMQVSRRLISQQPVRAEGNLDQAISITEGAIAEGRDAIQDLRSQPPVHSNLAKLLTVTGQELASSRDTKDKPALFRVKVEGEQRNIKPMIQDEAYRIVRELLRYAFQHANASEIEAEIRYEDRLFRLRVRDD
jgi:signal transduction histidine kinase